MAEAGPGAASACDVKYYHRADERYVTSYYSPRPGEERGIVASWRQPLLAEARAGTWTSGFAVMKPWIRGWYQERMAASLYGFEVMNIPMIGFVLSVSLTLAPLCDRQNSPP